MGALLIRQKARALLNIKKFGGMDESTVPPTLPSGIFMEPPTEEQQHSAFVAIYSIATGYNLSDYGKNVGAAFFPPQGLPPQDLKGKSLEWVQRNGKEMATDDSYEALLFVLVHRHVQSIEEAADLILYAGFRSEFTVDYSAGDERAARLQRTKLRKQMEGDRATLAALLDAASDLDIDCETMFMFTAEDVRNADLGKGEYP